MNTKPKRPISSSLSLGCLCAIALAWAPILAGSWSEGPPMPTARALAVAGVIDGKLYVAGGTTIVRPPTGEIPVVPTLEVYDPEAGTWTAGPPMIVGRMRAVGAALDGKLFVAGGVSSKGRVVETLESYDPRTGTWTQRAPMPIPPTWGACSATTDGTRLYVACVCEVWAYEPISDQWTLVRNGRGDTPYTCGDGTFLYRGNFAVATLDGVLYIAGGTRFASGDVEALLEAYDTLNGTLTSLSPMPTPRANTYAGFLDHKLLIAGGRDAEHPVLGTLEVYDPRTDRWTRGPDMPTPRFGAVSGVVNGELIIVGGAAENDAGPYPLALMEVYDPRDHERVCICHFPSGDVGRARTICVDPAVAEAHMRTHGDTPAACGPRTDSLEHDAPRRSSGALVERRASGNKEAIDGRRIP